MSSEPAEGWSVWLNGLSTSDLAALEAAMLARKPLPHGKSTAISQAVVAAFKLQPVWGSRALDRHLRSQGFSYAPKTLWNVLSHLKARHLIEGARYAQYRAALAGEKDPQP